MIIDKLTVDVELDKSQLELLNKLVDEVSKLKENETVIIDMIRQLVLHYYDDREDVMDDTGYSRWMEILNSLRKEQEYISVVFGCMESGRKETK